MLTWPCWWELGHVGVSGSTKATDSPARRESDAAARAAAAAREVDGMPMGIQLYQGVVEAKVAKCKSEKYVSACWVWFSASHKTFFTLATGVSHSDQPVLKSVPKIRSKRPKT